MKKISFVLLSLFAFLVISCENEPIDPALAEIINNQGGNNGGNNGGGGNTGNSIAGTYILTAFNSSVPTDLNNDGTTSVNQMTESSCFNNMLMTLNNNGTFSADTKGVEIDINNQIACFVDPDISGSWSLQGNTLTLSYIEGGVPYVDVFTVVGNTLVMVVPNGEVVGTASGAPVYLTSTITLIYTKQ